MKQTIKIGTATGVFDVPDEPPGGHLPTERAKGRLPPGVMNGTERRFSVRLEYQRLQGEILWWKFHALRFILAPNTSYEIDFMVMGLDGQMSIYETKGGFVRDDAIVKLKVAAAMFPFQFYLATEIPKKDGGGFIIKPVTA